MTQAADRDRAAGAGRSDGSGRSGWSERRVAWVVLAVGGALAALAGALLVPWSAVPGGAPDPVAAEEWFSAAQLDRAEAYSARARAWSWPALAVSLLVASLLGLTGLGERLVRRLPGPWPVRTLLAVAAVLLLGRVATLPFAVGLHDHQREAGLSTQAWPAWARDLVVSQAVGLVVTGVAVLVLVGTARLLPRAWPAVVGGALAALVALGSFVYPVVVEPLFNEFEPLADDGLRRAVLELADREGVAVEQVLVADASRRTTTLNAYVSGFGGTRRVVLYDTTLAELPAEQTLSIVAHELAHARHDDVVTGTTIGAAGALAAAGLLALVVPAGPRTGRGPARGPRGVARPEAVPRVLAVVALVTFLASPVENAVSRAIETRADVDALAATEDPQAFAEMQVGLSERSLADPTPPAWSHWWFGSHPTVLQRIALAEAADGPLEPPPVSEGSAAPSSAARSASR